VNGLSITLQQQSDAHNIQGVMLGPNCPNIHSLLFADDLIICDRATFQEATNIHLILQNFCNLYGQTPNLAKSSIMFSKNVDNRSKTAVKFLILLLTKFILATLLFLITVIELKLMISF